MDEDQRALDEIMKLIKSGAKDFAIEAAVRHAIQMAFIRGAKHGMKMVGG